MGTFLIEEAMFKDLLLEHSQSSLFHALVDADKYYKQDNGAGRG